MVQVAVMPPFWKTQVELLSLSFSLVHFSCADIWGVTQLCQIFLSLVLSLSVFQINVLKSKNLYMVS